MDMFAHNINSLFEQLGLPSSDQDIERFIEMHQYLDKLVPLHKAPFWTPAQSRFIEEAIASDSDWAEVVDQFDAQLRGH